MIVVINYLFFSQQLIQLVKTHGEAAFKAHFHQHLEASFFGKAEVDHYFGFIAQGCKFVVPMA